MIISKRAFGAGCLLAVLHAAPAYAVALSSPSRPGCRVVEGVVAEVSPGPFLPVNDTVTTKATWSAQFRWDINDIEAIGWMRITDAEGKEVGWVPAGHEAVRCGKQD